jgi:hypothetical protein
VRHELQSWFVHPVRHEHVVAPLGEVGAVPAALQSRHVVALVAAVAELYFPDAHATHCDRAEAPVAGL